MSHVGELIPGLLRYNIGMDRTRGESLNIPVDRSAFSASALTDPDDSLLYWLSRPHQERLLAVERLRRIIYGHRATEGLQRILEVAQLSRS